MKTGSLLPDENKADYVDWELPVLGVGWDNSNSFPFHVFIYIIVNLSGADSDRSQFS